MAKSIKAFPQRQDHFGFQEDWVSRSSHVKKQTKSHLWLWSVLFYSFLGLKQVQARCSVFLFYPWNGPVVGLILCRLVLGPMRRLGRCCIMQKMCYCKLGFASLAYLDLFPLEIPTRAWKRSIHFCRQVDNLFSTFRARQLVQTGYLPKRKLCRRSSGLERGFPQLECFWILCLYQLQLERVCRLFARHQATLHQGHRAVKIP